MEEQEKTWPKLARFTSYDGINKVFNLNNGCSFWVEFVLSKRYWFIEWLVENDKIEKYKVIELEHNWIRPFKLDNLYWEIKLEERLLMLLSIQDNPIKFLISILKDKKIRTVYVDVDWNVSWDTKRYSDC